jgi:hypothetical protein
MVAYPRPALCAASLVLTGFLMSGSAFAGGGVPPRPHPKPVVIYPSQPHHAVRAIPTAGARSTAPVTAPVPRPLSGHRPAGPIWYGGYPYPVVTNVFVAAPEPPPLHSPKPLSFNVIDPYAVVSETPSGRIVVSSPNAGLQPIAAQQPYAPPAFHIIGQGSTRNMRGPVHVTHGVQPAADRPTGPKVIWLKEPSEK